MSIVYLHRPKRLPMGEAGCAKAQTDEGLDASKNCIAISIMLPDPHPARRAQSLPRGEGFGRCAYLSVFAGKIQENRRGFLGRFKEVRREIEIPPGSFSFCYFFFWRSKRKSRSAPANLQNGFSLMPASFITSQKTARLPDEAGRFFVCFTSCPQQRRVP